MSARATGTLEMKSWDEKPYNEAEGELKLTRSTVTNTFHGDIEGETALEYLMVYLDEHARFVGLERVVGHIGDRRGSFVLQHSGVYEDGAATTTWSVVPGSGTGELGSLRGEGGFVARHGDQRVPFTLDYDLG
jgi:hypothetical protein